MIHWRSRDHLLLALAALIVLVACSVVVRDGTVGSTERNIFHTINDWPDWLYPGLWLFQQFGNLVVAVVLVLFVAFVLRSRRLLLAAAVAVPSKLVLEQVVKEIVERQRPATSVGDVELRGDVSSAGLAFVSGHAAITAALATVLTPVLPGRWKAVPWVVVILNGVGRIYVGAHNPLDVVGGVALGVVIGGVVNAALAHRRSPSSGARRVSCCSDGRPGASGVARGG